MSNDAESKEVQKDLSGTRCSFAAKVLILPVRFYQTVLSPCCRGCCRFRPTCSNYAIDALRKHGAWRGALLTMWRILRCNPFCRGGYDPVPEEFRFRRRTLRKHEEIKK